MKNEYISVCKTLCVPYKLDYKIGKHSYSRTGSRVNLAIFPITREQLTLLIKHLHKRNLNYKILGATTNILFLDSINYNCFIYTSMLDSYEFEANCVTVDSGRLVVDFVRDTAMRGFGGNEGLEGIPGTIGGALTMNAGAYGYTISDNLLSLSIIDQNGTLKQLTKSELFIKNRSIPTISGAVVLSAKFALHKFPQTRIERLIRRFHISRHQYQEWVYPNLGSMFIVPSLNINENMRKLHTNHNIFGYILYYVLFKVWYSKPMFLFRRSFPEFNGPFWLMKHANIQSYRSSVASKTTVNTFANKDQSTLEILRYMLQVYTDANSNLNLENEIYLGNDYEIIDEKRHKQELEILRQME